MYSHHVCGNKEDSIWCAAPVQENPTQSQKQGYKKGWGINTYYVSIYTYTYRFANHLL